METRRQGVDVHGDSVSAEEDEKILEQDWGGGHPALSRPLMPLKYNLKMV